jgi:thiol:disulfide interchange protein DsbD
VSQQLTVIDPSAPAAENQWSEARVEELRKEGKAVFVDFTAAWCITCKVNEAAVIDTADFRTLLKTSGVEMLVGDWTTQDARITAILERHGRAGVPLYLLYPPDMTKQPTVLPQVLTQGGMEDAIAAF